MNCVLRPLLNRAKTIMIISLARVYLGLVLLVASSGCGGAAPLPAPGAEAASFAWATTPAPALQVPEGYEATLVVEGLHHPTQMVLDEEGWLWVVQVAGGETGGTGELVVVHPASGETRILAQELFKPTGVALLDGYVWLILGPELWRAPIQPEATIGEMELVTALPGTSRSSGTLTVLPDKHLLYVTSGPPDEDTSLGDGRLWRIDPQTPTAPTLVAEGFAMPYAHTVDSAGRLWVVNMTEDIIDGTVPPDALFMVDPEQAAGGAPCYYYYDLAEEYADGKAPDHCGGAYGPVAFFPAHTTPTSIVVSPWEEEVLLVTFWISGEIIRVELSDTDGVLEAEWDSFVSGLVNAHHLLVLEDGSLLVSDFGQGKVYRIRKVT
jgi:glucose/arabinose dehydrogenase